MTDFKKDPYKSAYTLTGCKKKAITIVSIIREVCDGLVINRGKHKNIFDIERFPIDFVNSCNIICNEKTKKYIDERYKKITNEKT